MIFNKQWIDEWVENDLNAEQLSDMITMAGLEVDSVSDVADNFDKVVVGKVLDCVPHPDSDHMHLTHVDVGEANGGVFQIVCGAPNCREGLKVCCSLVGAHVNGITIKKAKLRGVESNGMLCSYKELGMAEESDGIIELPEDAPLGMDIREYFKLNDKVIDVDLTSNRPDCLGISGIAREVAVLLGKEFKYPEVKAVPCEIDDVFPVELEDSTSCPRYLDRVIRGVNQKAKSPVWMVEKLRRCGIRSVSPIVDVTNYVMLEYSQPLHSFDLNKLHDKIVVRKAKKDEPMTVLSGEELKLQDNTLVIADSQGPVAMAGIFGGLNSGIDENTTDVLLESAFFTPDAIKGRARQYGLDTDASHRFERGVDHANQLRAIERATALLIEIAGGKAGPVNEAVVEDKLPTHNPITLRMSKLTRVLGKQIDEKAENGVSQVPMIAGICVGDVEDESWTQKTRGVDFFDMKGDVETLLNVTNRLSSFCFARSSEKCLHPGQSADIMLNGVKVGFVGMLHPSTQKALGFKQKVGVFEILRSAVELRDVPSYEPISKFPSVRRDFAFVIDKSVAVADLVALIREVGGKVVTDVKIFDVFEDESLGDKRSVAVGVIAQDVEHTLEESEVEALAKAVVDAASSKLGAVLRS